MEQPRSWHDEKVEMLGKYSSKKIETLITEKYNTIESVDGLKTILHETQKRAIKAMYDLETNPNFELKKKVRNPRSTQIVKLFKITSNAGVLSEPPGSGKTIMILSIILLKRNPRCLPDISGLNIYDSSNCVGFTGSIRKKFTNILSPTIIFVGASVLNQWIYSIEKFTDLKYFSVCGVRLQHACWARKFSLFF